MSECPSCGATLTGKMCACGYAVRTVVPRQDFKSAPQAATARAFAEKLREVNAYVEKYQQQHPGASKREACLEGLKRKGLSNIVPAHIRKSA